MNHVIIGAGPAGVVAAESLRKLQENATITLVGDEPEPPYSRMALPYYLINQVKESGTYLRKDSAHFSGLNIDVRQDSVASVNREQQVVSLASGGSLPYDNLLVATGSRPVSPPISGIDLPGVYSCWTLDDARNIAKLSKPGAKVLLMGAGFIGCIVLEALVARKVELTVIEMADRMLARMMDDTGAEMLKRWCENQGVRVLT
ncbi:MAG: FAD/NAD(P)-binding oxidoreductase, partial [Gammaproteobacteria bacterium]